MCTAEVLQFKSPSSQLGSLHVDYNLGVLVKFATCFKQSCMLY
jgi:hypothetical protein